MAFYEIQPDVIQDRDTGRIMKVDRDTVSQLRNNGQLLPAVGSGLRGAGGPGETPPGPPPVGQEQAPAPAAPTPAASTEKEDVTIAPMSYDNMTVAAPEETMSHDTPPPQERQARVGVRGQPQQQQPMGQDGLPYGIIARRIAPTRGGMRPHSESMTGIRPEQQAELVDVTNQAASYEASAIMKQAEARYQQAEAEKDFYQLNSLELKEKSGEMQNRMQQRDTFVDNEVQRLNQLIDAAAHEKPRASLFGEGDTQGVAGGVLAMIGLAMSQYASGITGQKNIVSEMINSAINEKLQSQREQIRDRLKSATSERDDLRQMYSYYDSRDQNMLAAVETKTYMNALEAIMKDGDMKAAHPMAEQAYAQLGQRLGQLLLPIHQSIQQQATRQYVAGSPGGVRYEVDPRLKVAGEVAEIQKKINESSGEKAPEGQAQVFGGHGQVVGTLDKSVAAKLNEEAISVKKMVHILDQIEELQKKGSELSAKDRGWLQSLDVLGALQLAQSLSFRVGTEEDFKRASDAIGSGNWDYFTNKNQFKASQMKKLAIDGINKSYSHYNLDTTSLMEELTNRSKLSE